jgi:hypothetical protein
MSSWNPFDWNSNDLKGVISGAGSGALAGGLAGGPLGAVIGGIGGGYLGGVSADNGQQQIKGAEAQKASGIDALIAQSEKIKQQRIARQQATLQQSMAASQPARDAIAAVYGPPSSWKL